MAEDKVRVFCPACKSILAGRVLCIALGLMLGLLIGDLSPVATPWALCGCFLVIVIDSVCQAAAKIFGGTKGADDDV